MVNVYDYAHNLARALKEAPEYKALLAARARLKGRTAAEEMVRDFHKKQIELQSLLMQGKEPPKQQQEALERLYAVVQNDAEVRDFLTAEHKFSVILNDVYKILGEAVDVDIPGFERQQ